jgi:thiol-disulfide isomerase/thioredoxin
VSLLIAPLRGGYVSIGSLSGFHISSIVGFAIYFILTPYFLIKAKNKLPTALILVAVLAGLNVLTLPIRVIDFQGTLGSDLETLIHISAVFLGYVYYKSRTYFKILTIVISVVWCLCSSINGYNMWIHLLNFKTYTGKIDKVQHYDFQFQTNTGDTLSLKSFHGKYVLLDCWFSYCGICYKKMPDVQKLYDKYKDDDTIVVFALHSRMNTKKETSATGTEILKKEGYTYPCLSIDMENPVLKELGVNCYPTVLIFDKGGNLIFRGSVETASNYVNKLFSNTKNND